MIRPNDCLLFLIDVQEKLIPTIFQHEQLVQNIELLLKGCQVCDLPQYTFEQYPKGLGKTVEPLKNFIQESQLYEKTKFSAAQVPEAMDQLKASGKSQIIIAGIESHVCVFQTVEELIEQGYEVFIPHETTSSRSEKNREVALKRMEQLGASITCIESVFFELLRDSRAPQFKELSALIR